MKESLFLQAFEGINKQVPVWFMRQAGRCLPRYQALREKHLLEEMFRNPHLAAEITHLPVDILGVDAAILFADILTLPSGMGFDIRFDTPNGPVVSSMIKTHHGLKDIHDFDNLEHVVQTIKIVKEKLPASVALIGFAGSPFTVAAYLMEGGSSLNFAKMFRFIEENEPAFHNLMDILTRNTIHYLNLQKEAGAQVFQLFDSWAGILRPADFARWVLPYVRRIFEAVDLPSIYFVRNCAHLLALMDRSEADFLSVDHTVVLGHHTVIEKTTKGIQGNLFNGLLYADYPALKKEVNDVLIGGQKHGRYIFNLSHGVFPDTDPDKLKFIVEQVHAFDWKN
ncbi:MAG: uroporphyrinogen decarboxylase [Omnitrophica WOR_2 bacterium RIFCSPLOWO2_12_FULL_50_9]|nr:MAG: uroporphyrinogen decarboxylase [Omnitrophica WOR_2 bacterium RIFCSPHIGHO2_02_FULL_50_17]OGX41757.1 MAG: uroporphyrinogen decarboxylase [Omnitrophica WOR_2 bacterium RIFCSPLOWO2_12_FULL_50_9]